MRTERIVPLLIASIFAVIVNTKGARNEECLKPLETGFCRAGFERWGFDTAIQQCRTFTYGGCGDYPNSFETEEECNAVCEDKPEREEPKREFVMLMGNYTCKCSEQKRSPYIERRQNGYPPYHKRY